MRRRRRSRTVFIAVLIPLALVLGVWLGGHPDCLPGFARETLVADTEGRIYEEAVDTIERDYYREIDRKELLDKSLESAVESLEDQFSHYFTPREYTNFQLDTEGRFEGVGMSVQRRQAGPARRGGLRRLAGEGGRPEAGRPHRQRQRPLAGGQDLRGVDGADQGPVRAPRSTLGVRDGKRVKELQLKRAKVDIPIVAEPDRALGRQEDRLGERSPASRPARARTSRPRCARSSRRAPRASCSTCATTAAGCSTRPSRSPRCSSRTAGSSPPRAARARSASTTPTGGAISRDDPGRRARRRGVGLRVGDRHRRAAGPQAREGRRHAHVRQGRLPGDRAARQRRRAGHHGRRVLHAVRRATSAAAACARAPASRRTSRPPTIRRRRATRRCEKALADGRRGDRRRPREARPLPRRRAVLRARQPRSTSTSRAAASASATSCRSRRAAAGGRGSCAGSGARTSRATCSTR